MEFHPNDWLGRWQNFESYITSTDPHLQLAWQEAEAAAAALPMFKSGAKQFWQTACVTTSIGNPHTLGGWTIPRRRRQVLHRVDGRRREHPRPGGLSSGPHFEARA